MHVLPGLIFTLTALSTIVLAVPAPAAAACPDTAIAATGPYGPLKPSTLAALSTASRLDLNTALSPPCAALPTTAAGLNITCATTMDSPIVSELQGAWEHLKAPSKAAMDCTNFRPKNCSMVAEFTVPSFDGGPLWRGGGFGEDGDGEVSVDLEIEVFGVFAAVVYVVQQCREKANKTDYEGNSAGVT
ncbi:hypothetical protein EDC01DRAFT_632316 [Geopyxis carbonaria]|nr:hypothetical protein EDC01DRAFT_632316 [Geopyxis carbonaria]